MSKVEWKRLGDCMKVLRGCRLTKSQLSENELYPVYHGGIQPIGYYTQSNRQANTTMIINVGASAGTVGFCDTLFWSSDGCFCLSQNSMYNQKFLFHYLKYKEIQIIQKVRKAGIPTLDSQVIENIELPIVNFNVQRQIVSQLDTFTTLIAKLESELTLRQKQYEFYREKLLNFDGDEEVEWKKLGEICDIGTGNNNREDAITDGLYPFFVRSKEVFRINKYLFDEEAVIIPGEGGIGDIFHYVSGKYGLHQRAYRIHPKACIYNCKYIYYYLAANFKQYIVQKSVSATVTSIRKPMLEDFCICIPSPELQQYIVDKLDTFTTLISKLESEITLRRKQYEFYREKLLTFE